MKNGLLVIFFMSVSFAVLPQAGFAESTCSGGTGATFTVYDWNYMDYHISWYANNVNCGMTSVYYCPSSTPSMYISVYMDTEANYDKVAVYNKYGTWLEDLSGGNKQNLLYGPYNTNGLRFSFSSDGSVAYSGFQVYAISCTAPAATTTLADTTAPTASLAASSTSITKGNGVTLTITASDVSGVNVIYLHDPEYGDWRTQNCYSATPCTKFWTLYPSSSITYTGYVSDAKGNAGYTSPSTKTITVTAPADITAPTVTVGSPTGTVTGSAQTLSATTDEAATCKYSTTTTVYGSMTQFATTGAMSHSQSLTGLTGGAKTYYVRCRDAASNEGAATASFTVNMAPSSTMTVNKNTPVALGNQITVSISATDDYGVDQIQFYDSDAGSWNTKWCSGQPTSCTKEWIVTPTAAGTKNYQGNVYDKHSAGAVTSPSLLSVEFVNSCVDWIYPGANKPSINNAQYVNYVDCSLKNAAGADIVLDCGAGNKLKITHQGTTEGSATWHPDYANICGNLFSGTWGSTVTDCNAQTGSILFHSDLSNHDYAGVTITGTSCYPADSTPPVRSSLAPANAWYGSRSQTLSLTTDEAATCKYSTTAGTAYGSMTNTFTASADGKTHTKAIATGADGTFHYYVRCSDSIGNKNSDDSDIWFSVDTTKPTSAFVSPTPADGNWVRSDFTIKVDGADTSGSGLANCKYNVCDGLSASGDSCDSWPVYDVNMDGTCTGASSTVTKTITVGPSGNCRVQGSSKCQVQSYAKDYVGNTGDAAFRNYGVDYEKPMSSASVASGTSAETFDVSWTVFDFPMIGASGAKTVTIYSNTNGGLWYAWASCIDSLPCWASNKIPFTGEAGKTYGFYSIAADVAGNVENAPASADATTKTAGLPSSPSPSNGGYATTLTPTLSWTAAAGADCYAIQILDSGTLALEDIPSGTSYVVGSKPSAWKNGYSSLSWQKAYTWKVWPSSTGCAAYSSPVEWTFNTKLPAPLLNSPADGASVSATPALEWQRSGNANCYKIEIDRPSTTQFTATKSDTGATVSYAVPSGTLDQGKTYTWRIKPSNDNCGTGVLSYGIPSNDRTFATGANCAGVGSSCNMALEFFEHHSAFYYYGTDSPVPLTPPIRSRIKPGVWNGYWKFTLPAPYLSKPSYDTEIWFKKDSSLTSAAMKVGTTAGGSEICSGKSAGAVCKAGLDPYGTYYATVEGISGEGDAWIALTATPNDCGSLAPVSDIVSVGACSVTITHKGFDYSDRDKASDNGAVRYKNNGQLTSVDRQIEFDDAPGGGCDMDMKFTNVWDAGGMNPSTLRINTINVDEGASHYLLHGYSLQTSNCKFDKKFKIVSLPWSPDLPFINIVSSDSSLGTASFYDYCSAGSMTNIDCTLPSNTQYIKILQGGDKGSSQSLVIDFPVYECLPSENTNTAGSNAFCASKNATKPYCDTNTKKCYGCSITNNEPSGVNAKPNLNDCGTSSDGVTIGRCALVSGASVGGTCAYETTCNVNPDCSTSCCSKESSPGPSNNPGICITPVSASNPINPYLCKNG